MMIIKMPTLKQYLKGKQPPFKMRPGQLRRCRKVERLVYKKQMAVFDACRIAEVSVNTYNIYKKARR